MKNLLKNNFFLSFLTIVLSWFAVIEQDKNNGGLSSANYQSVISETENKLHARENEFQLLLHKISVLIKDKNYSDGLSEEINTSGELLNQKGFYFLIYENNLLSFWSDNRIAFDSTADRFSNNRQLLKVKNGWYEIFRSPVVGTEKTIVGLLLIKNEYSYQNQYLVNELNPTFDFPEHAQLVTNPTDPPFFKIKSNTEQYLFSINFIEENNVTKQASFGTIILLLFLLCSVCYFVHLLGKSIAVRQNGWTIIFFALSVAVIGTLSIYFEFPEILFRQALFNSQYYASSVFLDSLGDLLIVTIIIFYLLSFFYKRVRSQKIIDFIAHKKMLRTSTIIGVFVVIFFAFEAVNFLLYSLIFNSGISLNVNNILGLNIYSVCGFIIIGLLFFSLYLLVDGIVRYTQHFKLSFKQLSSALTTGIIIFGILNFISNHDFFNSNSISTFLFALTFLLIVFYIRLQFSHQLKFSVFLLVIFLFSVTISVKISLYNTEKEKLNRQLLAVKLEKEQDHIAEHLFEDIEQKIANDSILAALFEEKIKLEKSPVENGIKRIHQLYFNGYWSKYDSKIHAYDADGNRLYNSNNENVPLSYFQKAINDYGTPTYSNSFFFLTNSTGRISYIARLPIMNFVNKQDTVGIIIIELDSKFIQEESGFPELLLSDKVPRGNEFANYSYAKYKNGFLVSQHGQFSYYSSAAAFGVSDNKEYDYVNKEGYEHLLYKTDKNTLIVLSRKNQEVFDYITAFSYLFAFFCLFLLALSLLKQVPVDFPSVEKNFKGRIRLFMIFIPILSLVITGVGTAYYLINQYDTKQNEQISQRVKTLLIATENLFGNTEKLNTDVLKNLTYDLMSLSIHLSTDFSIYDIHGNRLFSTQPKVFEQEIISNKMNPDAYDQLTYHQKTLFIHNENIGKLNYTTAYESIRNPNNKLIGYLAFPYFSKQSELKKEIASFLVALINIYVLLFVLALTLSLIIANRITQPLKIIQERLGKIKLGKRNEPIHWEGKDEIGELVDEYNRMVEELTVSAEMLAKSEREMAWREMAKQVAHEIKNPLTPMKLTVQHLQKAWNDKSLDIDKIINRFSQTLVQQIDTLSAIATEFSNFAQMPKANNEMLDLVKLIENTINLFKEIQNTKIIFHPSHFAPNTQLPVSHPSFLVLADNAQLIRVFTNLINNAIQAIPQEKKGVIEVRILEEKNNYIVSITDNGVGINEEQKEKIFVPNFTTKTGGTGLGLAITKNIIEYSGGKIWFETQVDMGTTFYVSLPKYKESIISK